MAIATTRRSWWSGTVGSSARYRKVHIPGHEHHEPDRPFQHAERHYFEPGPDEPGVWPAFGGRVGMMICNDRRWPETYRVMGLQGVELILCGYNTPIHYAPDPSQDILQGFHNALVMQSGAYQNGTWVVGVAKGGVEEGVDSLAQSCIIAPSGQIVAQALTTGDELVTARCDLDWCRRYTGTLFDFDRYRRPELYGRITAQRGVEIMTAVETGTVGFTVNGTPVSVRSDHPHLLAALREELDITSPKDGCSPSGQCGCCTVLVEGRAVVACQTSLAKVEGRSVVTLEGFDAGERQRFADAFAACGGLQCGFCIPGIVVRAKAQIDKKGADLTRGDMARHLGAHLCRCTGYVKVLDAIEAVAAGKELEASLPGGVGTSGARYEAGELTLGDRGYVDDIRVPGMLHAALRLTDHSRADIHRIDIESARKAPGVVAVYTAADIPGAAAGRDHPHGLADHDPRGRPHVLYRRRAGHRRGRDPPAGPGGGRAGRRWTTACCSRSPIRRPRSTIPTRRCGERTPTRSRCPSTGGGTPTPR